MKAILYQSQTGFTKKYAEMLSQRTGLPAYDLGDAREQVQKGTPVIFMGHMKAGDIVAYDRTARRYDVKVVFAVGIELPESAVLEKIKKRHSLEGKEVYYLRGGLDLRKVYGIERRMLQVMRASLAKSVSKREKRDQPVSGEERDMLTTLTSGGDFVRMENLDEFLTWFERQNP